MADAGFRHAKVAGVGGIESALPRDYWQSLTLPAIRLLKGPFDSRAFNWRQ